MFSVDSIAICSSFVECTVDNHSACEESNNEDVRAEETKDTDDSTSTLALTLNQIPLHMDTTDESDEESNSCSVLCTSVGNRMSIHSTKVKARPKHSHQKHWSGSDDENTVAVIARSYMPTCHTETVAINCKNFVNLTDVQANSMSEGEEERSYDSSVEGEIEGDESEDEEHDRLAELVGRPQVLNTIESENGTENTNGSTTNTNLPFLISSPTSGSILSRFDRPNRSFQFNISTSGDGVSAMKAFARQHINALMR